MPPEPNVLTLPCKTPRWRSVRPTSPAIVVALVVGFAAACAPPSAPSDLEFEDRDTGAGADAATLDVVPAGGDAIVVEDLEGAWLHYQQVSTCVDFGDLHFEQYTRYTYLVEVEQNERDVATETWTACSLELSPVLSMQPTVTPALLTTSFPVVTGGYKVFDTDVGAEWHSGPVPEVWGIDFAEPATEPFPYEDDDPRIYDSDADGNPGATLIFGDDICRAYMVNRTLNNHHGEFVAPDRIAGSVNSATEQNIIDATGEICGREYITRDNQPRNVFERVRIDGRGGALDLRDEEGTIDCETVLLARPELIERIEADDASCDI